jgi:hypothetical protein
VLLNDVPAAAAVGFTTIAIVALCPFVMVPRVQFTVVVPVHVPSVVLVDTHVTFAGNVSVTATPVAALGPLFVTTMVYVRSCPASTGLGEADFVIETSAEGFTVVVVVEVLLLEFGSATALDTHAVLLSGPAASGVTTIVTVALAPLARVPMLHVTTPPVIEHVPRVVVAVP